MLLGNPDQVVMVADRRLTSRGRVVDDESNKAALLVTRDARLLVGFTGLAADYPVNGMWPAPTGRFRTSYWILETLLKVAPPDHHAEPMIRRFSEEAEQAFERLRVGHPEKGLSVGFTGYTYAADGCRIFHRSVSNFIGNAPISGPSFSIDETPDERPLARTFTLAYGCVGAIRESDVASLGTLLVERRPAKALVGKAVEVMRETAGSKRAAGAIGSQLSTAVLPSDPRIPATIEYHTDHNTNTVYGIGTVEARGGSHGLALFGETQVRVGGQDASSTPALQVAKVERNTPCPCKSGRRYKHCHGR
jgi:hypothetical protein